MEPSSKRREDYRKHQSSLNLHRNHVFASPAQKMTGNVIARICGIVAVLCLSCGLAWAAHMYFALHSAIDGQDGNTATSARIRDLRDVMTRVILIQLFWRRLIQVKIRQQ